jgi:hypothetical protein
VRNSLGCLETGCGLTVTAAIHRFDTPAFRHAYLSPSELARRAARGSVPALCGHCAAGAHDGRSSEVGCLETVAPAPDDYVCTCQVCKFAPRRFYGSVSYSSSQGVLMGVGK